VCRLLSWSVSVADTHTYRYTTWRLLGHAASSADGHWRTLVSVSNQFYTRAVSVASATFTTVEHLCCRVFWNKLNLMSYAFHAPTWHSWKTSEHKTAQLLASCQQGQNHYPNLELLETVGKFCMKNFVEKCKRIVEILSMHNFLRAVRNLQCMRENWKLLLTYFLTHDTADSQWLLALVMSYQQQLIG